MISIERWTDTTAKMRTLGVELPPEDVCINPAFKPTLFVASRLLRDNSKFGASVSYIHPSIEQGAAPAAREFDIEFPEPVLRIARAVRALGGRAVLVGGCIRDLLYDQIQGTQTESKDFDLEVYGLDFNTLNKMLHRLFPNCKISNEGKSYGVTKVYAGLAEPIDVAIPREEISTGDSHQAFDCNMSPRMPYLAGMRRRDLRFNSVVYDPILKVLYDPFLGEMDLQKGEINVTDPETFVDDPLRVLRIMQFIGRFDMEPTAPTIELCKRMVAAGAVDTLSAERIRIELSKLLTKSKKPSTGLQFAQTIGFIQRAWPELNAPMADSTLQAIDTTVFLAEQAQFDADTKLLVTLTTLCHTMNDASEFLKRLKFTKELQAQVLSLVSKIPTLLGFFEQESLHTESVHPISVDPKLIGLARKLFNETGLLLPTLMLVVAANHGDDFAELSQWFTEKTAALQLTQEPPQQLFNNTMFLADIAQKAGGPWLGIIETSVLLDQDENIVTTIAEAQARGHFYFAKLQQLVGENENCTAKKHYSRWGALLRYEDPRQQL